MSSAEQHVVDMLYASLINILNLLLASVNTQEFVGTAVAVLHCAPTLCELLCLRLILVAAVLFSAPKQKAVTINKLTDQITANEMRSLPCRTLLTRMSLV